MVLSDVLVAVCLDLLMLVVPCLDLELPACSWISMRIALLSWSDILKFVIFVGQSYELKLKKLGELGEYRGKLLKVSHSQLPIPNSGFSCQI